MKKINLFLLLVLTLVTLKSHAQVNENLLMERFNMNAFNPAYAGSEGRVLSFTTRSTWQGVSSAPKMNYFYFSGNPKKNLAFGVSIINNKVFIDERTLYAVDASYQLTVGSGKSLSLGIKAGAHTKFTDVEAIQRLTNAPNAAIPDITKETYPVIGFGFLYKTQKFYASVSVPNFLNPIKYTDNESFIGDEKPATYLLAGYKINFGSFNSSINPFVSSKIIPGIGNTVHFGGTYDYKGIFEVGGGYKTTQYMNVMAIIKTKFGFSLAYAYDFRGASNDVEIQKSGSEIFLKFK
ncbi:MAG: PorP/SprF family type IX secretion system membrane protein, partial [Flavobacteriaceae bacterium]